MRSTANPKTTYQLVRIIGHNLRFVNVDSRDIRDAR